MSYVCRFCEKEFTQQDVENGTPVSVPSRVRLVRLADGTVHNFSPIQKKKAKGAFVQQSVPPITTPPTESMEAVEPIATPDPPYRVVERKPVSASALPDTPSVEVEDAAEKLQQHWNPGQPNDSPDEKDGVKSSGFDFSKYTSNQVKAEIGEIVDCEVCDWHGAVGLGVGFAFILPKSERRGSLYIRERDIISAGEIHVGSFMRCEVAPPSGVNKSFEGISIEIY